MAGCFGRGGSGACAVPAPSVLGPVPGAGGAAGTSPGAGLPSMSACWGQGGFEPRHVGRGIVPGCRVPVPSTAGTMRSPRDGLCSGLTPGLPKITWSRGLPGRLPAGLDVSHLAGRDWHEDGTGSLQPPPMAPSGHQEHAWGMSWLRCWAGSWPGAMRSTPDDTGCRLPIGALIWDGTFETVMRKEAASPLSLPQFRPSCAPRAGDPTTVPPQGQRLPRAGSGSLRRRVPRGLACNTPTQNPGNLPRGDRICPTAPWQQPAFSFTNRLPGTFKQCPAFQV